MKTLKYLGLVAMLAVSAVALGSHTTIPSGSSEYQAALGDGWDSQKEYLMGHCLTGKLESQGTSQGTANFQQNISLTTLRWGKWGGYWFPLT